MDLTTTPLNYNTPMDTSGNNYNYLNRPLLSLPPLHFNYDRIKIMEQKIKARKIRERRKRRRPTTTTPTNTTTPTITTTTTNTTTTNTIPTPPTTTTTPIPTTIRRRERPTSKISTTSTTTLKKPIERKKKTTPITEPVPKKTQNKCGCKELDLNKHSLCPKNCGCSKNGLQCTINCGCKGVCSNGKSISDELFFKVWRNKYIRTEITGDDRLNEIREKVQFRKDVIEHLNYCGIGYNNIDIDYYTKLFGSTSNPDINVGLTIEKYYKYDRIKRFEEFYTEFLHYNYTVGDSSNSNLFRFDSEIFKKYVDTRSLHDKLNLPPIREFIIKEIEAIESVKDYLRPILQKQGLEFNCDSRNMRIYFAGFSSIESLIRSEKLKRHRLDNDENSGELWEMMKYYALNKK